MSGFFTALAHLFGLVPGLAVLKGEIGTPPGYGKLFGGVIEGLGAIVLALLWLNRDSLKLWPKPRVMRWAVGLAVGFIAALGIYLFLFDRCVVTDSRYSNRTIYYPISLSGVAGDMVRRAGSRSEAIFKYGPDAVQRAVDSLSDARSVTTMLLLLIYQAIFTCLTAAFGIIGFGGGKDLTEEKSSNSTQAAANTTP